MAARLQRQPAFVDTWPYTTKGRRDSVEDEMDRRFAELDRSISLAYRLTDRNGTFMKVLGEELKVDMEVVQRRFEECKINQESEEKYHTAPGTPVDAPTPERTLGCLMCDKYGPPEGAVSEFAHSDFLTVKLTDFGEFEQETDRERVVRKFVQACYMKNFGNACQYDCLDDGK